MAESPSVVVVVVVVVVEEEEVSLVRAVKGWRERRDAESVGGII